MPPEEVVVAGAVAAEVEFSWVVGELAADYGSVGSVNVEVA